MDIELITIGTELLLGFTVDTNGAEIARSLAEVGVRVVRRTSVTDDGDAIRGAVGDALRRTGAVITTGGLGPTRDDISKKVVADLFDAPLEFDESIWQALVARFERLGRTPVASNRSQAEVPRGATVLPNRWGTAPGLLLEGEPGLAVMLPGVPSEMRKLLEHEVRPRLAERAARSRDNAVIQSRVLRTTSIPESTLAERLGEIEAEIAPLTLAYLPGLEGVDLRITAWGISPGEAERRLAAAADRLRDLAGSHAYGEGDASLAAVVLDAARTRRATIAVAESCTGGLLGGRLTDPPGSSDVFLGGVIAYANQAKTALLDVPAALIAEHGAVSEAVACAMAEGAARRLGASVGLSVTGIAGPGGGTPDKPVGTVWLGVHLDGETAAHRLNLFGNRREIRERAVQSSLYQLWRRLAPTPSARAATGA
jgi:nicotinamide-nucleotide amidase